eukprot:TRINITY_DN19844_c0_g2_i1.p1 TRINITY_DN19844_c0_g2~~TRINITY_DN19844_c0_g2_i1.p1  ORF type:complete len:372 (+),score=21.58 TRINITY_DN19844_c0_g2_i1:109-1224(+)
MAAIFNPRLVEPRFRRHACCIAALIAFAVSAFACIRVSSILTNSHFTISGSRHEVDTALMRLPSFCVCAGAERLNAQNIVYMNFSAQYPDWRKTRARKDSDIEAMQFFSRRGIVFFDFGIDLSLAACEPREDNRMLFKGSLAMLPVFKPEDIGSRLQIRLGHETENLETIRFRHDDRFFLRNLLFPKMIHRSRYVNNDGVVWRTVSPSLPDKPVLQFEPSFPRPSPSPVKNYSVHLVNFDVHPDEGLKRSMVIEQDNRALLLLATIGTVSGLLSFCGMIFGCCFPKLFPYSTIAASYEYRTLRGNAYSGDPPRQLLDRARSSFIDRFSSGSILAEFRSSGGQCLPEAQDSEVSQERESASAMEMACRLPAS